jgi:hypothetical protein
MKPQDLTTIVNAIKASGADLNAVRLAIKRACDKMEAQNKARAKRAA